MECLKKLRFAMGNLYFVPNKMTCAQTTQLRWSRFVYYSARCEHGHWRTGLLATPAVREHKSSYLEQSIVLILLM